MISPQDRFTLMNREYLLEQSFARKLLHIPGPDHRRDVDNEVRAIMRLCRNGHRNIVSVLKFGDLRDSAYYFIDMELCDLNLAVYIHRAEPPNPSESLPYFIKDASSELRAVQIWNIMRQLAGGIKYIHGSDLVHRDVKPANGIYHCDRILTTEVLYSRKDSVWKLADFGITSEGTARRPRTTTGARGTPGYRAPELLSHINPVYNNKVDIWSLGCILYELASGSRLFNNDWAVIQHQLAGKNLEINLNETFGDQHGAELSKNITLMLRIQPQARPSANTFFETFTSLSGVIGGFLPDDKDVERLGEAYTDLSMDEGREEERRRIDKIIKVWHDTRIDILHERNEKGETAIHRAAERGDLDKIKALKKLGADFKSARDYRGCTPIYSAAFYGQVEAIKVLNEYGVNLSAKNDKGNTAMHCAARNGHIDTIKTLTELGVDVSVKGLKGSMPIHWAAEHGQATTILALRSLGADVSGRTDSGASPMHQAAKRGQINAIEVLKELGADVSAKADNGTTPIHSASYQGQVEAISKLVELGADLSAIDNTGHTAIHAAAAYGQANSIKALKEAGHHLATIRGSDGWTAMHLAAAFGQLDCIRMLYELGANLRIKTSEGQTPYEVANFCNQDLAATVLKALGAAE
jgi:ankyrin repeat protein